MSDHVGEGAQAQSERARRERERAAARPGLRLTAHPLGPQAPTWWGILLLVAIELTVFGGLIAIYYYLKLYNPEFPPPSIEKPELLLPSINTVILIASGVAVFLAGQGIARGNQLQLKAGKIVALALAITFLVLKYVEYSGYEYDWSTHAYGSIVWTMTGFHVGHVIAVVLKTAVVLAMALKGMFAPHRRLAVQLNGIYWYFVVLIWLPLYFTIYIVPRL